MTGCATWKQADADHLNGFCTNTFRLTLPPTGVTVGGCSVCVSPIEGIGNCANCILPPPAAYNVTISVVPLRQITYYRWLPAYAALGLVEDPIGWTQVLVNDGQWYNPGNCGYSTSYNLKEEDHCIYVSEESERIVSSFALTVGSFNTSATYDIICKLGGSIPGYPNFGNRKRVRLVIEGVGSQIRYHMFVRYCTEYRGPFVPLNPLQQFEIELLAIAPDRDCWKPFSYSRPLPYPTSPFTSAPAVVWSMSIVPGAQ